MNAVNIITDITLQCSYVNVVQLHVMTVVNNITDITFVVQLICNNI